MKIVQIDIQDNKQRRQFLELPARLYANMPQWAPPLASEAADQLNPRRHPFYKRSEAAFFLAYADGESLPSARLAVLDNRVYNEYRKAQTAFFYLFECANDPQLAQGIFESGFAWARQRGLNCIEGPKGFMVLDGFGLLVRGFEHRAMFGLPYNHAYYEPFLLAAGFKTIREAVSGRLERETFQMPERLLRGAELLQKRRGLRIAGFNTRKDLQALIPRLKELYNQSLLGTTGTFPIDDAETRVMANQILWFADPHLIKVVMKDDEMVGFLFAYPDISDAIRRCGGRLFPFGWLDVLRELRRTPWLILNGAGMIAEYRGLGGTAILFSEMYKTVRDSRFDHGELVQIGVENEAMQRELRDLGVDFYKTYRYYQRDL